MFALNNQFWLECGFILLVVVWIARQSGGWKQPLFWFAVALFVVAMNPWLDTLARHSIWLHSWQSVVVHHLVPMLWLAVFAEAGLSAKRAEEADSKGDCQQHKETSLPFWLGLTLAGLLSWIGMLPAWHQPLMDSPVLYALGKWAMALGGVWLCLNPQRLQQHALPVALVMLLPLVGLGLAMVLNPLMYRMTTAITAYPEAAPLLAWLPLALPGIVDQWLGGAVLLSGAFSYWLMSRVVHGPLSDPSGSGSEPVSSGIMPPKTTGVLCG
ncbi:MULTISPECIES: cytochrome c oxidase assembly protein [unclassified Oceanobacter]|uniref:cytochrome c oxidase assembly protein n=1 Tax=unclassified Oceanobacter TaxID=2620260 RepID=UPI0026E47F88|nr:MULTISPECIES: cytochrome c oxidase assembly protein [unclassified Oceanobacter]MDO6682759.1 cytochrome c oxidase assembly protein [Oceanobacter sp. 5_MG-2023]MDP2546275.1 cytochrome c oxidase assembly protein [Oceanobacter sp. 4_MG-2023]MDP2607576.1 cytochrome c oxidase assembly protein [Oceanobacter sp. 1_MG-2023]MDP2610844.1 cytochrome c oxidase assembly protein [Oceanobacter sp. 2_MG-2023]